MQKKFILFIAVGRMVVIEMLTEQQRKRFQKKKKSLFLVAILLRFLYI